jgi:DNA-binding response OmpR family regulator
MADQIVLRINAELRFTREEVEQILESGTLAEELWREMKAIAADDDISLCGREQDLLESLCYDAEEALERQADGERLALFGAGHR